MEFTEEQRDAITAMRPLVCVSAGAGSGKTTILVERIAHILDTAALWKKKKPQLDRIAAITFTEKAAAEMKARLRRKFRDRPDQNNKKSMTFWREMERQVETAHITTIHSFCASLLREYSLHIGMDPDWGTLTDVESSQLMEQVIDETVLHLLEAEDPATQNLSLCFSRIELKQALTGVLSERWKYQDSEEGVGYDDPDALLQYWNTLVRDLFEDALLSCCESGAIKMHLAEFQYYDGYCSDPTDKREIQRKLYHGLFCDMEANASDLPEKIRHTLKESNFRGGSKKKWGEEAHTVIGESLKAAKEFLKEEFEIFFMDPGLEQEAAKLTCNFYQVSKKVMEAYRQERRNRAAIDFDDMINETLWMLKNHKELRRHAAQSLRFLLIDEFQDTDNRQLDIARLLAEEKGGPDLFIVGDAKQSIYLFRGAEVALFKKELKRDPKSIALPTNYRSLPGVIWFINDFFSKSCLLAAVEKYEPMQSFREPMDTPRVELFVPDGDNPEKREAVSITNEREAQFIARRICEMCDGSEPLQIPDSEPDTFRDVTYDDIVLLFRRGSHIYAYESALREAQVPYNRIAGEGYFKRREIEDVLALLKLTQDPWDEEALLTVLRSPLAVLSDESLMRLAQVSGGLATAFHSDIVPEKFEEEEALQNARALFKKLYALREMTPGTVLRIIMDETKIESILLSQALGLQRVSNLQKMIQMADNFAQTRTATLAEFTHYLEDIKIREIREGEAMLQAKGMGAVTLMTIHKSKGLEFPVVFLPEMWAKGKGPTHGVVLHHSTLGFTVKTPDTEGKLCYNVIGQLIKKIREREEMEEAARVLYVAMTRARDYLVLCGHANPHTNSWAEALNEFSDSVVTDEDSTVLCGDRWEACIKNVIPESLPVSKHPVTIPDFDIERVRQQIATAATYDFSARESISVSQLLLLMTEDGMSESHGEAAESETKSNSDSRETAMLRGTLVHRMFELWDFKKDRLPDIATLIGESGLGLKHSATLQEQLEGIAKKFRTSEYMELFAKTAEVCRETPFILAIDEILVHGVIDVLLDNTLVVDYKTGKRNEEREQHYEDQLLLYAAALRNIKGEMPDKAMLWYADYGEAHVFEVRDEKVEEVLARARAVLKQ